MTIDRFTRQQFEAALPTHKLTRQPLWQGLGLIEGEYTYAIPVNAYARIKIRSSVNASGIAADSGDDSIRLFVEVIDELGRWHWIGGSKPDAYTTRVPGWGGRLTDKMRDVWAKAAKIARPVPTCTCGAPKIARVVKKPGSNQGRIFASHCIHGTCQDDAFVWLDEAVPTRKPVAVPQPVAVVEEEENIPVNPVYTDAPTVAPTVAQPAPAVPVRTFTATSGFDPGLVNDAQRNAIFAPIDLPVRVLAGPGSGKTHTIERRYAYLLHNGVLPRDILVVTFNKSMAGEVYERICRFNPAIRGTEADNQVCTIHAACFRVLKAEGLKAQPAKDWQLKKFAKEISAEIWPNVLYRPGPDELIAAVGAAEYRGCPVGQEGDLFESLCEESPVTVAQLVDFRRQFDANLRANGLITFGGMLYEVDRRLAIDPDFKARWQGRFKYIIIDEGQDTTGQAMRVLTTLGAPEDRMFIVGDTDQLLYRFAGATPEQNLYQGFEERYPSGLTFKLTVNYRSTRAIVDVTSNLIAHNYTAKGGPYAETYRKLLTARPDAPEGVSVAFTQYGDVEIEALETVRKVKEAIDGGRRPQDFFLATRTRAQLGYLEIPLTLAGIPFVNLTGGSFWESKHVKDAIAYLRLLVNPGDTDAFARVYNIASRYMVQPWGKEQGQYCPHRYLGRAFLDAVGSSYANLSKVASDRRYKAGVNDLRDFMQGLTALHNSLSMVDADGDIAKPGALVRYVLNECYADYLKTEEGFDPANDTENSKSDDLLIVAGIGDKYPTLEKFLEFVNDAQETAKKAAERDWSELLVISTIHRLKGLERPVVFGLGISEGEDLTTGEFRGLLPHTFSVVAAPKMGVLNWSGKGRVEDERCAFFVLISRPKEELHLSSISSYRNAEMRPSRFLAEAGIGDDSYTRIADLIAEVAL
jgi:DNA helicase-2/ATP-dependent DNA helicase PcrA